MRLFFLLCCLQSTLISASPQVVTSIVPLQEITATIMDGVSTPSVIIGNDASAHHFAFKPSHLRLLQQADLVIWIDRRFEAGFHRITDLLQDSQQGLELMPALVIGGHDGHIWLSPELLLRSTDLITSELVRLDPTHRAQYQRNARQLASAIEQWRQKTLIEWQNKRARFITDHAFTSHFGAEFGVNAIATIHDQHDAHGSLHSLQTIENRLQRDPAVCLLTYGHQASRLAQNLARKYHLKTISILQIETDSGAHSAILQRLQQLNQALRSCV